MAIDTKFNERKEFWKDTPEAERMDKWRNDMNALLDEYKNDPTKKAAQTFLKKIIKRADQKTLDEVEVSADTVYSTFIEGTGGDVEYFVRLIIEKTDCNIDEIEQNLNLITKLGSIYGTNSGKIATQLIQDILNAKKDPALNDYTKLYSIIGTDIQEDIDVGISQKARRQSLYIVGAPGTGKSTLDDNLILTPNFRAKNGVSTIEKQRVNRPNFARKWALPINSFLTF
jgi:predicted PilT family ATPase